MRTSTGRKQLRLLSQDGQVCTFEYRLVDKSTCRECLQILSIPGLALKHKNVIKKLWEIITKKATQVGHLQNEKSKKEGPKVSYTGLKLIQTSKNLLKPVETTE